MLKIFHFIRDNHIFILTISWKCSFSLKKKNVILPPTKSRNTTLPLSLRGKKRALYEFKIEDQLIQTHIKF